ncbi:MAG TPA: PQQ-binding-like beta-propeller repeat protein [Actinomycetota bacterium]|nr:PQQ-binding-like beta-propeller repeat protein [Actinomycetota bacterium]
MRSRSRRSAIPPPAAVGLAAVLVLLTACTSQPRSSQQPPLTLPPGSTTSTAPATGAADWTTYHRDNARTGYLAGLADPTRLARAWSARLDGAVYAEPLVVGDRVLVATERDSLYALSLRTGQVRWHTRVGEPVPLSSLPCGNIDPLGITGTPVYDPATGLVFAVAEVTGPAHVLVGVDARSGKVRVRRTVDPPGMDVPVHQQRAALALSRGKVYVAYGGLFGDCGDYRGRVVASSTDGRGPLLAFQVPTRREAGIWAASGPAVNAQGELFVSVGNGAATGGAWDRSDSVLRLRPDLRLDDGFAPRQWPADNAGDLDLGSMGPSLLPGGLVFAAGKSGLGYLLRGDHLGGVGGQVAERPVCRAFGGSAAVGSTLFVPCTDGVRQVRAGPGRLDLGWRAPQQVSGSPVVGGRTVYSVDAEGGTLYALDAGSGAVRASAPVGRTSRFATPTLAGGLALVGTLTGVTALSARS